MMGLVLQRLSIHERFLFCHWAINDPISAGTGSRIAEGVREKRGAGAGCFTP
jgi:hypothetical protein